MAKCKMISATSLGARSSIYSDKVMFICPVSQACRIHLLNTKIPLSLLNIRPNCAPLILEVLPLGYQMAVTLFCPTKCQGGILLVFEIPKNPVRKIA